MPCQEVISSIIGRQRVCLASQREPEMNSREESEVIVCVHAIEKSELHVERDVAAAYDVRARINEKEYTFRACVQLAQVGEHTIQNANLCDDQSRGMFRWHQIIPVKICKLVFAIYNGEPVELPVYLDES